MLALARALMARPRLMLLDEPSLGLAPLVVQSSSSRSSRGSTREEGVTVLVVEQNANVALDVSHRAYVLEVGRVALAGAERRAREATRASEARYLGY